MESSEAYSFLATLLGLIFLRLRGILSRSLSSLGWFLFRFLLVFLGWRFLGFLLLGGSFLLLGSWLGNGLLNLLGGGTTHLLELFSYSLFLPVGVFESSGLLLLSELLLSDLLLLHLVDGLDQHSLVFVEVTLGSEVEVMVDVLGDLLCFSVFPQKSSQHSLSSHPQHLLGHSCVLGTLSLTMAGVSACIFQQTQHLPFLLASWYLFTLEVECM